MREIYLRKSVRRYKEYKVEKRKIDEMLKAGMQAPSATNERPWEFIVIESTPMLIKLSNVTPYSKMIEKASHAIIVACDMNKLKMEYYWQQDMAACVQNMLLEAVTQDIGAVWIGIAPCEENIKNVKELIELPENIVPFAIVSIGYPLQKVEAVSRFEPERIHNEKW